MERKTVLITGTSSGIGRVTADLFTARDWNVAATTRQENDFFFSQQTLTGKNFLLDVANEDQCKQVIDDVIKTFGGLDVLINNAGLAILGAFEESSAQSVTDQFKTNLHGPMALTRYVLPHFRRRRSGLILTVSTLGGRIGVPFYSVHAATKFAVEGFFESLRYELHPFNIGVKLIEPGGFKTSLLTNGEKYPAELVVEAYHPYLQRHQAALKQYAPNLGDPKQVAEIIWEAATDGKHQLRYIVGADAIQMEKARQQMSDEELFGLMGRNFLSSQDHPPA